MSVLAVLKKHVIGKRIRDLSESIDFERGPCASAVLTDDHGEHLYLAMALHGNLVVGKTVVVRKLQLADFESVVELLKGAFYSRNRLFTDDGSTS